VKEIVVVNAVYHLSISSVILEIFALKVHAHAHERTDARKHEHFENIMPPAALHRRRHKKLSATISAKCSHFVKKLQHSILL